MQFFDRYEQQLSGILQKHMLETVLSDKMIEMPMGAELISTLERRDKRYPLPDYIESLEKEIIRETLLDKGGNISKTAEDLGISRQALQHKMRKYGFK